jgi:L-alanine-DL-glutamate epimerase-like enolase superfamily enzyme
VGQSIAFGDLLRQTWQGSSGESDLERDGVIGWFHVRQLHLESRGILGPLELPFVAQQFDVTDPGYGVLSEDAPFWPHWTWLKIDTDSGVSGIGETYPRNPNEAAAIHGIADQLIGSDPRDIERIWADLYRSFDYQVTGGAEMRALSAIDLALWDLLGKSLDAPVYRLIGGKTNPRVRLYNTCFPYKYDFNREPEKIMRELIDTRGIRAIKVWPFDGAAQRNGHQYITQPDIDQAIQPVTKLRDAFGNDIEIAMEFHSNWEALIFFSTKCRRAVAPAPWGLPPVPR